MLRRLLFVLGLIGLVTAMRPAQGSSSGWSSDLFPVSGVLGQVNDIVFFDEDGAGPKQPALYIAGSFSFTYNSKTFRNVAKWDGTTWDNMAGGMSFAVYALAVCDIDDNGPLGPALYATGSFLYVNMDWGGVQARRIAQWTGSSWTPLGSGLNNGLDNDGHALIPFDWDGPGGEPTGLMVGGSFSSAGGWQAYRVARWGYRDSVPSWSALPGTPTMNNSVRAFAVFDSGGGNDELYAGGNFTAEGGTPDYITRWSGEAWLPVGTGGDSGVDNTVYAMTVYNGFLYVGGLFDRAGLQTDVNGVARFSGSSWSKLGIGVDDSVRDLLVADCDGLGGPQVEALYAGGWFLHAGGAAANHTARWNWSSWEPLSGGTDQPVFALAIPEESYTAFDVGIYAGGGGLPSIQLKYWTCGELTGDIDGDGDVDIDDFEAFGACMAGPDVLTPPLECVGERFERCDLDGDGDADLNDFNVFEMLFPTP